MVTYKKKKHRKLMGHTTHGWGSRKKRRGAGSRGGRGNAGSGKRAGQKKTNPEARLIGQNRGFTSKSRTQEKAINLGYFTKDKVNQLVAQGLAKKEGDHFNINLEDLGYNKLLGTGKVELKLKITVPKCSAQVEEKIKSKGGEIIVPK